MERRPSLLWFFGRIERIWFRTCTIVWKSTTWDIVVCCSWAIIQSLLHNSNGSITCILLTCWILVGENDWLNSNFNWLTTLLITRPQADKTACGTYTESFSLHLTAGKVFPYQDGGFFLSPSLAFLPLLLFSYYQEHPWNTKLVLTQ
jgi:hypothetical protein